MIHIPPACFVSPYIASMLKEQDLILHNYPACLSHYLKERDYYTHSLLKVRATWLKISGDMFQVSARWLSGDLTDYRMGSCMHSSVFRTWHFKATALFFFKIQLFSLNLQNTLPLICMSLNKNSIYCVMLRSSKNADQRKQWWYRVAGYSAVAPKTKLDILLRVTEIYEAVVIERNLKDNF